MYAVWHYNLNILVGMVRVAIKEDPDHREPPNSVGALNHFFSLYSINNHNRLYCEGVITTLFVLPACRGGGLGAELVTVALGHCREAGLRAVEMSFDGVEEGARKICEEQDWSLESLGQKKTLGVFSLETYTYRKPCCLLQNNK